MIWLAFGVFFVCLTAESWMSWRFIYGSRKRHPALWRHAGCPTVMGNSDLVRAWPLVRYVSRRAYRTLPDSKAVSFADEARRPMMVSYWASVGSAAVFFSALLIGR